LTGNLEKSKVLETHKIADVFRSGGSQHRVPGFVGVRVDQGRAHSRERLQYLMSVALRAADGQGDGGMAGVFFLNSRAPIVLAFGAAIGFGAPAAAQTYSLVWLDEVDPDGITYGGNLNGHTWSADDYLSDESTRQAWIVDGNVIFDGPTGSATDADWQRFYAALDIGDASSAIETSAQQTTRNAVSTHNRVFNNRINSAVRAARPIRTLNEQASFSDQSGSATGLSGGDMDSQQFGRWGIWASATGTWFTNDLGRDDIEGQQYFLSSGVDYRYDGGYLAGASIGYERVSVNFEGGGYRKVDYIPMTIYGAWLANDSVSLSAFASYAPGVNHSLDGFGNGLGRDADDHMSHRFMGSTSVTYLGMFDRITAEAAGGLNFAYESFGSYKTWNGNKIDPEDTGLGQIYASGSIGYALDAGNDHIFEPYATVQLEYDFLQTGGDDNASRFGSVLGGGLRFQSPDGVSFDAYGNTELGRHEETSTSFGLSIRFAL
jgi:hypothetical protein